MKSVFLLLMVSVTQLQLSSLCPNSCIVCSTDAIICSKLSMIIEAPDSTKALMLTDGLIDTVDRIVFSDLSNMSVLVLSNNIISNITGDAFQNLTVLRTLSLDHNLISSPSLDRLTFSWLHNLETLHLGHNALEELNGSWFQKTNSLKTLLLAGNLLTSLNSSTFASSNLRSLETLDLSDNLISYVGRDTFRNLPRLSSLDLSRNRLQNVPDAFSYLSRLSMLNLDLNRWNCSCELKELSQFLNSYIQSPLKVLCNGKKMACANSDNPDVVQTVLELTEANCMPADRTITAGVNAKSSITSQRYIRDVAIAVVFSCLSGVIVTLAIFAVVQRKLGRRFNPKGAKGAEEQSSQTWDFSEGSKVMSYAFHNSNYRGHPPCDKEDTSSDSRPDTMGNHFICQNCRKTFYHRTNSRGIQPNNEEEWSTYMSSDQWKDTDVCPSRINDEDVRAQRHNVKDIGGLNTDYRRQPVSRQDMSTVGMHQIALRRQISIAQRQAFAPDEQPNNKMALFKQQHGVYGSLPIHHYSQTYADDIHDDISRNKEEGILPRSSKVIVYKDILNFNQSEVDQQGGNQARVQRSVTFDLSMERALFVSRKEGPYKIGKTKMSKTLGEKCKPSPGKVSAKRIKRSTHSRHSQIPKARSQGSIKLKVKLNLSPLRRSQVHPKSGSSHDLKEVKRTSKNIKKDKSQKIVVKKDSKGGERKETSKKAKITNKLQCVESSTDPGETQGLEKNPEDSCSLMQTSTLLAESVTPLGTENSTDPQIPTLDLSLAVSTPEDARSLQKELQMPNDGVDLSNDSVAPMPSTVSVVQEYLSSGDGSPKRKLRLIVPEKTSSRPQTALEKKIR
ncbi:uncharacterized protein lrrc53 [Tachysurus fulvidraco]|uniref:uncharacterized protein lrrc53 n=1 Tax=Tachysurus fulvidraco TaxID=1234273 RepID=UPI001FEE8B4A|nr:uncharacterized protein lrrc53 [Tachysurus fulvidraco]